MSAQLEPLPLDERKQRFLVLGAIAGAAGIGVQPLAILVPNGLLLVLFLPLAAAAFGVVRDQLWLVNTGAAAFAVLLLSLVVAPGLAVLGAIMGPLLIALVGGHTLLRADRVAGGAWLVAATIAVVFGFAAAGAAPAGAAWGIVAVLAVGAAVASVRILRLPT